MNEEPIHSETVFRLEGLIHLWMRGLALIFLFFAVRYWALLVGFNDDTIRFDTMPTHWQVAAATLSVCYPVGALGVWGFHRWGIVVWFITAMIEIIMHVIYPQLYGQALTLVIFHLASMIIWLLFVLFEFLANKKEQINI